MLVSHDALHRSYPRASRRAKIGSVTVIQIGRKVLETEGMAKGDFLADKRTQQAVILNLIILGEAVTKLMDHHPAISAAHSGIEWRAIRGMRNRIAHGYYDINLDVVWDTVRSALPELVGRLAQIDDGAE